MKRTPTTQQAACIAAIGTEQMLKIEACAGSGKTSTLDMMAQATPVPSLYLGFNKVTATEASEKFPKHVTCKTTHSVAYGAFGTRIRDKLARPKGRYVNVAGTGSEIGKFYKLTPIQLAESVIMSAAYLGLLAKQAVALFEQSADDTLTKRHLPRGEIREMADKSQANMDYTESVILKTAQSLWKDRTNVNSPVLATHDTYLKMYQLSKPVLAGYQVLYLDEAQDTTPCVLDIVLNQSAHMKVVLVGDERQAIYCQPAGTLVTVVTPERIGRSLKSIIKQVPIEDVMPADLVLAYDIPKSHLHKMGKPVTRVGTREYVGQMVTVEANGQRSKYTEDHHVIVRLGDANKGKQVVYMMKKGNQFRVGVAPWQYAGGMFGAGARASAEGADSLWLLGVYDKAVDALLWENYYSSKFGIPQVCFKDRSQHAGHVNGVVFWKMYGENIEEAKVLLSALHLDLGAPLWGRKGVESMNAVKMRSNFVIPARNLVNGMLCAVMTPEDVANFDSHSRIGLEYWHPVTVSTAPVATVVYSLEVADDHTYFGDNILTHNCWRGAVNAMKMVQCESRMLTKSFRYGQVIANIATNVLEGAMQIEGNGSIQSVAGFTCIDTALPYTRLFRTNAALLTAAVAQIKAGTKISIETDVKDFVKLMQSAVALEGGDMKNVKHDKLLAFKGWAEMTLEAKNDPELGRIVKIVKEGDVADWINTLSMHVNSPTPAVTFTTCHKAKGREWSQVRIEDDFKSCYDKEGKWTGLSEDEQNLLYVAVTRAIDRLEYNKTVEEYLDRAKALSGDADEVVAELEAVAA